MQGPCRFLPVTLICRIRAFTVCRSRRTVPYSSSSEKSLSSSSASSSGSRSTFLPAPFCRKFCSLIVNACTATHHSNCLRMQQVLPHASFLPTSRLLTCCLLNRSACSAAERGSTRGCPRLLLLRRPGETFRNSCKAQQTLYSLSRVIQDGPGACMQCIVCCTCWAGITTHRPM